VAELLKEKDFDLIITDIQMPIMDGFELLKNIQNNPKVFTIPVIALSGRKDLNTSDFTDKGFTAYHPKPIHTEKLLTLLSNLFGDQKVYQSTDTVKKQKELVLFSLKSLSQFTQNDPKSLKVIIETFITSAKENCEVLQIATKEKDEQSIVETAHKMIPMLKQIEAYHIVEILDNLEDRKYAGNWKEIELQITNVNSEVTILIHHLELEIN
jgi:CheY-like chemotaxis protein